MLEHIAIIAKSIGSVHRLAILEVLLTGECSVDQVAKHVDLPIANTSQHLQHLKRVGLVQFRKVGKHSVYRIAEGPIGPIMQALRHFAEFQQKQQANEDDALAVEAIGREELLNCMQAHSVLLLDVRPKVEYEAGCLPGAINIPIHELADRISQLPKSLEVVAYCRGPLCNFSKEAALLLQKQGLKVRHFEENVPLWQAAGLPLDQARS